MEPFRQHRGTVAPLLRENIDTDQIIPKQHLKSIERTGFGAHLFSGWRFHGDGTHRHDFVLNQEHYRSASILVVGKNFGCGSSREHAAWALQEFGFRAIIAPSYADIFRTNAGNNGLLLIELEEPVVRRIAEHAQNKPPYELTIDLETQTIADDFWSLRKLRGGTIPPSSPPARTGRDRDDITARSPYFALRRTPPDAPCCNLTDRANNVLSQSPLSREAAGTLSNFEST